MSKPRELMAPAAVVVGVVLVAILGALQAEISMPAIGVPVAVDFAGFEGGGFVPFAPTPAPTPQPGTLDSNSFAITGMSDGDLAFGGTATSGDYARGITAGGVTTGGCYAFDRGAGDVALGFQPTADDMSPGTVSMRVVNRTGGQVTEVTVSYDIVVRNDEPRANTWTFSYATDAAGPYTALPGLDFTTPAAADPSPAWVVTPRVTTIAGIALQDGDPLYLRWTTDDSSGSGSRDELGVDNVVVTATEVPVELMRLEVE